MSDELSADGAGGHFSAIDDSVTLINATLTLINVTDAAEVKLTVPATDVGSATI